MLPLLLAITTACNLGNINANDWILIVSLVILASFAVGLAIYDLSTLLPARQGKKIRNTVIYEFGEGIISILIFMSLISLVYASCSVCAGLSGDGNNYQNLFQADEYYIGNLLFVKGTSLVTDLSFQGISLGIDSNIVSILLEQVTTSLSSALGGTPTLLNTGSSATGTGSTFGAGQITNTGSSSSITAGFGIYLTYSSDIISLFDGYSNIYLTYGMIIVICFGLLFILYFLFPIISLTAFTLLVPVALIMRSFLFLGPKIREVSNTILALAIAFYIVFPLTISMNVYVVNWVFCTTPNSVCNPYPQYTGTYQIPQIPLGYLFRQNTVSFLNYGGISLNLPVNFYSSLATNGGGVGSSVTNLLKGIALLPEQIASNSTRVSEYFFETVLLIAIDLLITIGFAQGLTKALETIPALLQHQD